MNFRRLLSFFLLVLLGNGYLLAQSDDPISLGELARSLRETKARKVRTVIDNENLVQVMDDVQRVKVESGTPLFTFDQSGKSFEMSSPDGTCSLSFNANATALISDPFLARDLPAGELANLDGSATLNSDVFDASVENHTGWNLTEITVALTIAHSGPDALVRSTALQPAVLENASLASVETPALQPRHSDSTILYHLKNSAPAGQTATFEEILNTLPSAGDEWHWAIVQAKGVAPTLRQKPATVPAPVTSNLPALAVPAELLPQLPGPLQSPPATQPEPAATMVIGQARP